MAATSPPLGRRLFAEFLGTALLVAVVVGSGIAAAQLSPDDVGLELLQNALATVAGLFVLIVALGPVSGAHFNPVVSLADACLGGLPWREVTPYILAQVTGGIGGAVLANLMFGLDAASIAQTRRMSGALWLSEVVATFGLLLVIFALARSRRPALAAPAVAAYIGSAYFFTASTSFANPAVSVGRMFSDTFAGISPASVPGFVAAQVIGAGLALLVVRILYPDVADAAGDVVVPQDDGASLPTDAPGDADRPEAPGASPGDAAVSSPPRPHSRV